MHVLIAEDNPTNADVLQQLLERLGHSSEIVENGRAAVEVIREGKHFDSILMDLQMPVMDGLEASRIIVAEGENPPPVIACTANAYESDRVAAKAAGMIGFLSKPIRLNLLEEVLAGVGEETSAAAPASGDEIDWEHFAMVMDGGDEELLEIFEDFCASVPVSLARLAELEQSGAWDEFAKLAHHLKGSFSTFGLVGLSDEMDALETGAKEGTISLPGGWGDNYTSKFSDIEKSLREKLGV